MNLQNIYNKYGEKDVSFMVVKYFKYIENARKLEDKLIKKYSNSHKCLNIGTKAIGGDNLSRNPNKDLINNKIKTTLSIKINSLTEKERRLKYGRKGSKNGMYGKHHSQETKKIK